MANPTRIDCPRRTWTKVVDNKTVGSIYLSGGSKTKSVASFVFMDAGEAAPTDNPSAAGSTAIEMETKYLPFNSTVSIDVYIFANSRGVSAVVSAE